MNILIVGCGTTGSQLAIHLHQKYHMVSVVDKDEENFELLGKNFSGLKTCGIPIDTNVLKQAGIEGCETLISLTEDDNVNVMVAQVAKKIFKIEQVIAVIHDPLRESIFSDLEFATICPSKMTVDAISSILFSGYIVQRIKLGSSDIKFVTVDIPKMYLGKKISELDKEKEIFCVLHKNGETTMANNVTSKKNYMLQATDKIVLLDCTK